MTSFAIMLALSMQSSQQEPDHPVQPDQSNVATNNGANNDKLVTPAQKQVAQLAALQTASQIAQMRLNEQETRNFWNIIFSLLGGAGGVAGLATIIVNGIKTRAEQTAQFAAAEAARSLAELKAKSDIDMAHAKLDFEQKMALAAQTAQLQQQSQIKSTCVTDHAQLQSNIDKLAVVVKSIDDRLSKLELKP